MRTQLAAERAFKSECVTAFVMYTSLSLTTRRGDRLSQVRNTADGVRTTCQSIWATVNPMTFKDGYSMPRDKFNPAQAQDVAAAFAAREVDYMFIGKSGAILLGYPVT